tara:strand:+ start:21 stop:413 length:393 start_codon:yes stop_codon:yes gene_type:complete
LSKFLSVISLFSLTGVCVAGLKEEIVVSPEQVLQVMKRGESVRHVSATNANDRSSRSHTLFRIVIESRERGEVDDTENNSLSSSNIQTSLNSTSAKGAVRVSLLTLVDLAGSERAKDTEVGLQYYYTLPL